VFVRGGRGGLESLYRNGKKLIVEKLF